MHHATLHVKHELGAPKIIEPHLEVFIKRKLSLIYLNERSKITMNGNFELFNISRASFLKYLDINNILQTKIELLSPIESYRQQFFETIKLQIIVSNIY